METFVKLLFIPIIIVFCLAALTTYVQLRDSSTDAPNLRVIGEEVDEKGAE